MSHESCEARDIGNTLFQIYQERLIRNPSIRDETRNENIRSACSISTAIIANWFKLNLIYIPFGEERFHFFTEMQG